jgi:hypothetical protein
VTTKFDNNARDTLYLESISTFNGKPIRVT